jgi:phosphotransacetylase
MSADGSWSVCTHEHLPDAVLFALRLLQRQSCQQMVHGVLHHEHLPDCCSLALRLPQRQSCQQMVHGVFALMNI